MGGDRPSFCGFVCSIHRPKLAAHSQAKGFIFTGEICQGLGQNTHVGEDMLDVFQRGTFVVEGKNGMAEEAARC